MVEILYPEHSVACLSSTNPHFRKPRWGWRKRPASFYDRFESRILFYDCFWGQDAGQVLLIGPPAGNLDRFVENARFLAQPSGASLTAQRYESLSTCITEIRDAPAGTTSITIEICDERFELAINENLGARLGGRAVLFTMSKNNDLEWIAAWARYHVQRHDIDTVLIFDNGSDRYSLHDVGLMLAKIEGLETAILLSWPYVYGAIDRAVIFNPYWTQFLQVSAMSTALRRFAPSARALVNVDIDELVSCPPDRIIGDYLDDAPHGLVAMEGQWMEAKANRGRGEESLIHSHFTMRLKDQTARRCKARKWIIDPRRDWVKNLKVHPYMHWIEGRPRNAKTMIPDVFFWHFKGINTNWKLNRAYAADHLSDAVEIDPSWSLNARFCVSPDAR